MNVVSEFFEKFGREILLRTYQHVYLVFFALVIVVAIAVPLGIFLAKTRLARLASVVMGAAGVIQTIPTLALVALVVTLLVLATGLTSTLGLDIPTIGPIPAIIALVLYALLPILRNTYVGIRQVDPAVVEVARGMGMRPGQILWRVELPLALPVIMAGLRIATIWTVSIAALCALVGAGGLGDLIMKGLRSYKLDYLIAGTVPAALLALALDGILSLVERWMTPAGVRKHAPAGP